jgi:hypothetical protein
VKATVGDTHIGGEDFDNRVVALCVQGPKKNNHGKDLVGNNHAIRQLWTQCERAKRTLSSSTQVAIDYACSLSRARFEELCMNYVRNGITPTPLEHLYDILWKMEFSSSSIGTPLAFQFFFLHVEEKGAPRDACTPVRNVVFFFQ